MASFVPLVSPQALTIPFGLRSLLIVACWSVPTHQDLFLLSQHFQDKASQTEVVGLGVIWPTPQERPKARATLSLLLSDEGGYRVLEIGRAFILTELSDLQEIRVVFCKCCYNELPRKAILPCCLPLMTPGLMNGHGWHSAATSYVEFNLEVP